MPPRRPADGRGLVMPKGRAIPRPPSGRSELPGPPPPDEGLPPEVERAGAELSSLAVRVRACEACPRACPDRVFGSGFARAPVLLLKDAPGAEDLRAQTAFAAEAEALHRAFDALGVPLGWVWGTTAVRCGDRPADADERRACSVHLLVELEAVAPRLVVAFGPGAVEAIGTLHGRCGIAVPEEVPQGEAVALRPGLQLLRTEPLPEGVTDPAAKRRLWRDLQRLPALL